VLNYNSQFKLFSFVSEGDSICPGPALDYVPVWWVGELHMVSDAHLFILQIHASRFEACQWGEMATTSLSMARHKKSFHKLGVQDVSEFSSG
jgi:hypothetical protein